MKSYQKNTIVKVTFVKCIYMQVRRAGPPLI